MFVDEEKIHKIFSFLNVPIDSHMEKTISETVRKSKLIASKSSVSKATVDIVEKKLDFLLDSEVRDTVSSFK